MVAVEDPAFGATIADALIVEATVLIFVPGCA